MNDQLLYQKSDFLDLESPEVTLYDSMGEVNALTKIFIHSDLNILEMNISTFLLGFTQDVFY